MRLRTENAEDRQFLEWRDQTHQDKSVPLRALLVPLMLKGIEAEKQAQAPDRQDAAQQRKQETWAWRDEAGTDGAGARNDTVAGIPPSTIEPEDDKEFPLEKLSFE